jgi:hypothetical protein
MRKNQLFYGSLDLTLLIEQAKAKHSAFTKGNNGKIYASINVWLNSEPDKFGNIMSLQINPSKEMKDIDKKMYVGNLKESEGPKPISDRDVSGIDTDFDVATRPAKTDNSDQYAGTNWDKREDKAPSPPDITEPISDLPF